MAPAAISEAEAQARQLALDVVTSMDFVGCYVEMFLDREAPGE